jgi:hypothetical protein
VTTRRRIAGHDALVAGAALAYGVATLVALLLPSPAKGWAVLAVSFGGCAGLVARDSVARGAVAGLVLFVATELAAPTAVLWEPAGGVTNVLGVAVTLSA